MKAHANAQTEKGGRRPSLSSLGAEEVKDWGSGKRHEIWQRSTCDFSGRRCRDDNRWRPITAQIKSINLSERLGCS